MKLDRFRKSELRKKEPYTICLIDHPPSSAVRSFFHSDPRIDHLIKMDGHATRSQCTESAAKRPCAMPPLLITERV